MHDVVTPNNIIKCNGIIISYCSLHNLFSFYFLGIYFVHFLTKVKKNNNKSFKKKRTNQHLIGFL